MLVNNTNSDIYSSTLLDHPRVILTPREKECSEYLLMGYSSKEIAKKMTISPRTVETYVVNIKQKFCCRKLTQLIVCLSQAIKTNKVI